MRRAACLAVVSSTLLVVGASSLMGGCVDRPKYKPEPAYSGAKASLPPVPKLPDPSTYKHGNSWTIMGLQHHLNNPRKHGEVEGKQLTIEGYVVEVYRPTEPTGKEGCIYPRKNPAPTSKEPTPKGIVCDTVRYEPPHFFIADTPDEKNPAKMVTVMGYASSYIQQYFAREYYEKKNLLAKDKYKSLKQDDQYMDNNYSSYITILGEPKVGNKVTVTGQFGSKYEEGQGGRRMSPFGIIDVTSHKKGTIECDNCLELISLK